MSEILKIRNQNTGRIMKIYRSQADWDFMRMASFSTQFTGFYIGLTQFFPPPERKPDKTQITFQMRDRQPEDMRDFMEMLDFVTGIAAEWDREPQQTGQNRKTRKNANGWHLFPDTPVGIVY
jgi:hypothetical protein